MSNERPGMVKVGRQWMTEAEAQLYAKPEYYDPSKKTIAKLTKKRSPYFVVFQVAPFDDGDEWFLYCMTVKRNTGKVMHCSTMIRKDLDTWIQSYESMQGFVKS